ncbi:unnamed protein product [Gongylonema pulchrum]|uniref:TPX2 domain-containing protein n=1 Tax=Gongylonema pulchrum TaxID=637853 RepID=A0A183E5F2_9BILA|nr:unnamed protein product [Gongylonema pulchrum]
MHQKLVEKQPTLQEADAKVKRKFQEHQHTVPGVFKRLATPKASKARCPRMGTKSTIAGYNFKNADADPTQMDFAFSKMFGSKKSTTATTTTTTTTTTENASPPSRIPRLRRQREPKMDVKQLTRNLRRSPRIALLAQQRNGLAKANAAAKGSVKAPQLSTRLRRLATPKGRSLDSVPLTGSEEKLLRKCGRKYVPRRGPLTPFVDTTAMTDQQFLQAKNEGKIPMLTSISPSRIRIRQEVCQKRQTARERALNRKRGLC